MRTVQALGEVGLIDRLQRRLPRPSSVLVGIGDDAAVLAPTGEMRLLFASDMLVEGVHFHRPRTPAVWIGWKALAVNVSDIAAMGGWPRWAVVSLGVPAATPVAFVDRIYAGLDRCARRYGVALVGGDTVRAPQVVIDVAIVGTVSSKHLTLRRGARAGDVLFVTGRLGGSYVSGRHARVTPRLSEAQELLRCVRIHAMMDLSDGLASDAWQMSRASRVRLQIEAQRVPVHPSAKTRHHAMMDGEDFELLFAVRPRDAARVPAHLGRCPVTRIGRAVSPGVGVELIDGHGRVRSLVPTGFRHF